MTGPARIADAGRITPGRQRDHAIARALSMLGDVRDLASAADVVVVEVPSGHVHGRLSRPQYLTLYGVAVGAVLAAVRFAAPSTPLVLVRNNVWTRGRRKEERAAIVAAEFRGVYDPTADRGMDVADAIGIAQWYYAKRRTMKAEPQCPNSQRPSRRQSSRLKRQPTTSA